MVLACTPCPIEVAFSREDRYVAELTFSTRETLEENIQDLLDYIEDHGDLHFTGGLEQTLRDVCNTRAACSWGSVAKHSQVKSIAPSITNWLDEVPCPSAKTVVDRLPSERRLRVSSFVVLTARPYALRERARLTREEEDPER